MLALHFISLRKDKAHTLTTGMHQIQEFLILIRGLEVLTNGSKNSGIACLAVRVKRPCLGNEMSSPELTTGFLFFSLRERKPGSGEGKGNEKEKKKTIVCFLSKKTLKTIVCLFLSSFSCFLFIHFLKKERKLRVRARPLGSLSWMPALSLFLYRKWILRSSLNCGLLTFCCPVPEERLNGQQKSPR